MCPRAIPGAVHKGQTLSHPVRVQCHRSAKDKARPLTQHCSAVFSLMSAWFQRKVTWAGGTFFSGRETEIQWNVSCLFFYRDFHSVSHSTLLFIQGGELLTVFCISVLSTLNNKNRHIGCCKRCKCKQDKRVRLKHAKQKLEQEVIKDTKPKQIICDIQSIKWYVIFFCSNAQSTVELFLC